MDVLLGKYVYCMYQVSSISKLLTLLSFITNNFGGMEYTDIEGKVGNLTFLPHFHTAFAT